MKGWWFRMRGGGSYHEIQRAWIQLWLGVIVVVLLVSMVAR